MKDIPNYETFIAIRPIDKGLSGDKKHYVETIDGQRLILRISDISEYDRKKSAYERMEHMDNHNIPMSRPIDFGVCDNEQSVYQLLTWCDGECLDDISHSLSQTEQFSIGVKAGKLLHSIHVVPIKQSDIIATDWNERYSIFIDESIKDFHKSGVKVNNAELLLSFFNDNRYLLKSRPQCYTHGDFHAGNLMVSPNQNISVVDWETHLFNSYGDPWHEISIKESPHFFTGFVRGYFNGEPPEEYWRVLAIYEAVSALSSITWAYYLHPEFLAEKIKATAEVLENFNNMQNLIPTWYQMDYCCH
jgi:serine/threonine-protein kinase